MGCWGEPIGAVEGGTFPAAASRPTASSPPLPPPLSQSSRSFGNLHTAQQAASRAAAAAGLMSNPIAINMEAYEDELETARTMRSTDMRSDRGDY